MKVAIVGATGLVGETLIRVMEQRGFPAEEIIPYASEESSGRSIGFKGRYFPVRPLTEEQIEPCDFAFFSAGGEVSRRWAPKFSGAGAVVIDKSSAFRLDKKVPLVVPEVNHSDLLTHQGIIANPNCSTIQLVLALYPLHRSFRLKSIVVTSFQSVSGGGKPAMMELETQLKDPHSPPDNLPRRIGGNCIPQIGEFFPDGETAEEKKFRDETRKILHLNELKVSATAVRVPVKIGHSLSVHALFAERIELNDAIEVLSNAPGLIVCPNAEKYPTPWETAGRDFTFVGRIRSSPDFPHAIDMWIVADNLRKGAATNALQIVETLIDFKESI